MTTNPTFVKIANVEAFLRGLAKLEERGAAEACYMLVQGQVGLGKTSTCRWYATQRGYPHVVMEPRMSGYQLLGAVCAELGIQPPYQRDERRKRIIEALASKRLTLICDEIEHGLANRGEALETLRGISDRLEMPMVLAGRENSWAALAIVPALRSRISVRIDFKLLSERDVSLLLEPYGIKADEAVLRKAIANGEGKARLIRNAVEKLRRFAKRAGNKTLTLELIGDDDLCR